MRAIKSILVPTDFSDCAKEALHEAIGLAKHFGANLTLLHVYQLPAYSFSEASLFYTDYILKSVEVAAQTELEKAKGEAERQMQKPIGVTTLLMGSPYVQIVQEASKGNYDLIVMGTHGRTGLKHFFVGSVAERVVQLAPCPVLTVRDAKSKERLRDSASALTP